MAETAHCTTSESQPDGYDFKINQFCKIYECFKDGAQRNNYDKLERIRNRYGVYIFLDGSGCPLYIGKAPDQTLKERITQNYTEGDTGGTFRKNWCSYEEKAETKTSDDIFADFRTAMKDDVWKVITISVPRAEKEKERNQALWIHSLERSLIGLLNPKYDKI